MQRFLPLLLIMALFVISWKSFRTNNTLTISPLADSSETEKHYAAFCAGCHGEQMNAFVDRGWKHGRSREDLFKGIKFGYKDGGMPGFDSAFSDKQIYALADYILEGIANVDRYKFEKKQIDNNFPAEGITVKLDTIATGIDVPWSLAFLPGGEYLVTDRVGKLYKVDGNRKKTEISGVPKLIAEGQGGLMDIVLHPNFQKNKWLYLSYVKGKDSAGKTYATTALMRAKFDGNKLTETRDIFIAEPYFTTRHHYGGKIAFDKKGYLFFSVGERGHRDENPQSLANYCGKIHRINDDGSIPADNPFVNKAGAIPSIYSYGHRNPQGLAVHPETGEIWENEHGPCGGDELNLIVAGKNYGWPVVSYGINYDGTTFTSKSEDPGIQGPLLYWVPSIAPSGMAFVTTDRYPGWNGDVMVGSLRFQYLNRVKLDGSTIEGEELLLKNIGRLRDVRMAPDGYLYVTVERPGYVFRLVPQ